MALLESRRGLAGQYGYQNNAPILNASIAQSLLGDEFYKKIDTAENELGWGTNSKYQGSIRTGVGLYGIEGSKSEIDRLLDIGQKAKADFAAGKIIATQDPETGETRFAELIQTDEGPQYSTGAAYQRFNTGGEEGSNAMENFARWQDITGKLQNAAQNIGIDTRGLTDKQVLDAINRVDTRVAVTGRTQFWDPNQAGIGGQEGPQHATVVYTQQNGKLIPVAPPQTFTFQDPNTSRGFFGGLAQFAGDLLSLPPISMALGAYLFGPGGLLSSSSSGAGALGPAMGGSAELASVGATGYGLTGPIATAGIPGITSLISDGLPVSGGGPVGVTNIPPSGLISPPSAFETAVNTALGSTPQIGGAGPVGTAGFGTALPAAGQVASGLEAAGFAPGTAANLAGTTAAGVGATNLLGGATAAVPIAATPGISPTDALRAANTAGQLIQGQQENRPPEQQAAQMAAGAVDYSGLLNLLQSQARTSGLLGTRYQPQPINLASLLG